MSLEVRIVEPDAAARTNGLVRAEELAQTYGGLSGGDLLRPMIEKEFPGRIALVSSFGAESAVLLQMIAEIDPATPIIFLDTGKLFGETKRYRDQLRERLGLSNIRSVGPDPAELEAEDSDGMLWSTDSDACCALRKTRPLAGALEPFNAWITGRKRFQTEDRGDLPYIEAEGGWVKINPLADWDLERLNSARESAGLPAHPLVADGYPSVGCIPCTDRVAPGGDYRDGRWAGQEKTECGIHGFVDGDGI